MQEPNKSIHVRSLTIEDYEFVRDTAARKRNFTIPPLYVLWLLSRIKEDICLVAEDAQGGRLAYLLAVPLGAPKNSMFIWQLAARDDSSPAATRAISQRLKELCDKQGIQELYFSAVPGSSAFKLITRYFQAFGYEPVPTLALNPLVAPDEVEFRVKLR